MLTDTQLAEIQNRRSRDADCMTLVAEVRRLRGRLCDFEDGHAYTKVRREADYWQAHHEADKRHAEGLILGHLADADRARARAAELEQENAQLRERLNRLAGQSEYLDQIGGAR